MVVHTRTFSGTCRTLAVAALAAVALTACDKGDKSNATGGGRDAGAAGTPTIHKAADPSGLKLAFVVNAPSEYWKICQGGVHKFEKESGLQVDFKIPSSGKVEDQNVILENLVSQGYDGIAVSVVAPDAQVSEIDAAARKTNVVCCDSDSPNSDRIEYVGTENFTAGQELGKAIVKLLPDGGKMAVFVGTFSADNAAQRLAGIKDSIKGHNIEVVATKEDDTDKARARSNVEDVINATPDLNLVCGLWSYNGPAIASAIAGSGKKGKVLAAVFDQEQGTLDGIKAGTVTCTVVQDPFGFGYEACRQLRDMAVQGPAFKVPAGRKVLFPVKTVDSSNIDQYVKDLAAQKAT